MKKILIASTNVGKVSIYKKMLANKNVELISLKDIKEVEAPEENGKSALENALIKAKHYHEITKLPVIANDSGLIISKFKNLNQPGLFVRRVDGRELTDKEMVQNYADKLTSVGGKSKAYHDIALAVIDENGKITTKTFKHKMLLINKASAIIDKGMPLNSLTFYKKNNKYLTEMNEDERNYAKGSSFTKQIKFLNKTIK